MKGFIAMLLACLPAICLAQGWQAEIFTGAAGYSGDLTQSVVQPASLRPSVHLNLKYDMGNQFYVRGGLAWGMIGAGDQYNSSADLVQRNLSFQTHIFEANLCLEYAVLPPDIFDQGYPYVFAGLGVFHFDPYTFDQGKKVNLAPLSTEGEGLPEYPGRKPYKLTQLCLPFGAGFTVRLNDQFNLSTEAGFRKLFTDYLDDVSTTYPDAAILASRKGAEAARMSYRGTYKNIPADGSPAEGAVRGNPGKNDWYYFVGLKLSWWLSKRN